MRKAHAREASLAKLKGFGDIRHDCKGKQMAEHTGSQTHLLR